MPILADPTAITVRDFPDWEIETKERPLYMEALDEANLSLSDLSPLQVRVLVAKQDPDLYLLNHKALAKKLGCTAGAVYAAFKNAAFVEAYMYIQHIMLLEHAPEIDEATMALAKDTDKGTHHDRRLAYERLGIFKQKHGGTTVNVAQNNATANVNKGKDYEKADGLCPADDFVRRFETMGGGDARRKTSALPPPDKD